MEPLKKSKVKLKNLMGIIDEPIYEDLLFEIVYFLDNLQRFDGKFKIREISSISRVRINEELIIDIEKLVELGYIKKVKNTTYEVVKHSWI